MGFYGDRGKSNAGCRSLGDLCASLQTEAPRSFAILISCVDREGLPAEELQPQTTSHAEQCRTRQLTTAGVSRLLPFDTSEMVVKTCRVVEELLKPAMASCPAW